MKNIIKFYDTIFMIMLISFGIVLISVFIVPEEILDKIPFLIPWYILLITGIICETIFIIGMVINAFKIKRYGWMVAIIFLGTIFPIIFYFSIMRKKFRKPTNKQKL